MRRIYYSYILINKSTETILTITISIFEWKKYLISIKFTFYIKFSIIIPSKIPNL
jgi:hypothetical protein